MVQENSLIQDIIKLDSDIREYTKEWGIIHASLINRPSLWKRIKLMLNNDRGPDLYEYRIRLTRLDKEVAYYRFDKLNELSKRAKVLTEIQAKCFGELSMMCYLLHDVVYTLNTINDHLIIERERGNNSTTYDILNNSHNVHVNQEQFIRRNIKNGVFSTSNPEVDNAIKISVQIKMYQERYGEYMNSFPLINEIHTRFIKTLV